MAQKKTPRRPAQRTKAEKNERAQPEHALTPSNVEADLGRPGGGRGREDATGVIRDNIQIDPNITAGHPGYEESGHSEIMPKRG